MFLILIASALSGCGRNAALDEVKKVNETHVAKIRSCYTLYKSRHEMKAPEDKEQLVKFLKETPTIEKNLSRLGVDLGELESYFVSERDGEEIIIHWGVDGLYVPPFVFEAVGVDGMRVIAGPEVLEVGDDEYQKYLDGKVKAVTPGSDEKPL